MLGLSRISTSELAQLCRRLSASLESGIDVRTVWAREVDRARGLTAKTRIRAVKEAIHRGESMRDALQQADDFFPPLFRQLADIGEQTGHLGESFRHLAEHYDRQRELRRNFLAAIAWPMIQLVASLAVIGFLIWIMGVIGQAGGIQIDPLGFGLVGNRGLVIYLLILALIAGGVVGILQAVRSGWVFARPIQRAMLRIPVLGPAMQPWAWARWAWSRHMAWVAGLAVRPALRLRVFSTRHARYIDPSPIEASNPAATRSRSPARYGDIPTSFTSGAGWRTAGPLVDRWRLGGGGGGSFQWGGGGGGGGISGQYHQGRLALEKRTQGGVAVGQDRRFQVTGGLCSSVKPSWRLWDGMIHYYLGCGLFINPCPGLWRGAPITLAGQTTAPLPATMSPIATEEIPRGTGDAGAVRVAVQVVVRVHERPWLGAAKRRQRGPRRRRTGTVPVDARGRRTRQVTRASSVRGR